MTAGTLYPWQYDEFKQIGTDYGNPEEVAVYDASHATFRDTEAESRNILDNLNVKASDTLVDFGAGTGTFAMHAARHCRHVHAVDVSRTMIDYAKAKAEEADLTNITFHHAGFLTYQHTGEPADVMVTTFAFHHLPDFWKGIALKRMHAMLNNGGRLYMHDVIMEENNALTNIQALIDNQEACGGELLRQDAERHFKDEFSTYDWVMDGLFTRAGFSIQSKQIHDGVLGTYVALKANSQAG